MGKHIHRGRRNKARLRILMLDDTVLSAKILSIFVKIYIKSSPKNVLTALEAQSKVS